PRAPSRWTSRCPPPAGSTKAPLIDCAPMPDPPGIEPGQAIERLDRLAAEAEDAVLEAITPHEVEDVRVRYLGRKAELTQILRSLPGLSSDERAAVGKRGNEVRRALEELISERADALGSRALEERLRAERIDVTLPGDPLEPGHLHLLTQTRREIEDFFVGMGYGVVE